MLEDIIDRTDRAPGLSGEVARLQGPKPFLGDGSFGGIKQPPPQRRMMVRLQKSLRV